MEIKVGSLERESIISVLSEGREVANELKRKLQPTTDSREACGILVQNILSSYENAMKLLDCMALLHNNNNNNNRDASQMGLANVFVELPNSIHGSPLRSEGSDLINSKDQVHQYKRRKTFPKWSEQVKVKSDTGLFEGQHDDGYNWRKYGQKGILGANHPRAYYRCTHRNTQGCLATKQVQRSDNDPSVFEVVYRGKHSCMQERVKPNKENLVVLKTEQEDRVESPIQSQDATCPELEPKPENQELVTKDDKFPFFSFPPTPIESENLETQFFSESSSFMGTNYSPRFLPKATSESYFSNDFGSDFGEIISSPTPYTNFSFGDLDFSIDQIDFSSQLLDTMDYF
ncbi:Probable WRKY transcription factor 53 [Striga hermonthica]|uniref:Probable WRKY transcription factor 53 n=1 Tax=Striga hermonthica TaxID=68872 RepID=A0A9N7N8V0_STRHE|nr:Probable WRKY transcription factor 53 [Striga hermonthica]